MPSQITYKYEGHTRVLQVHMPYSAQLYPISSLPLFGFDKEISPLTWRPLQFFCVPQALPRLLSLRSTLCLPIE